MLKGYEIYKKKLGPFATGIPDKIADRSETKPRLSTNNSGSVSDVHQGKLLMNIMNSLPNPFYVIDIRNYNVIIANSAAGFGNLLKDSTCYALTHGTNEPCKDPNKVCPLMKVKESKKPVTVEHVHYDYLGRARIIEVNAYPIFDDRGRVIQVVESNLDITDRKLAEEALKETKTQLEEKVKKATANWRRYEQLLMRKSRLALMGEMLNVITHQWRQPLNAISAAGAEMAVKNSLGSLNPQKIKEYIELVEAQTRNMSNIINEFIDFFRPQKEKECFSLSAVLENIDKLTRGLLKNKNIELLNQVEPGLVIKGRKNELEQALINIIVNAGEAYEEHPKDIQIIRAFATYRDGAVTVFIEDRAGGISKEAINRIFEPYFTTKQKAQGAGIGLYLTKSIIERNFGGMITVQNIGTGARFVLTFPIGD